MHPLRADIDNELHSRPPLDLAATAVVQMLALTAPENGTLSMEPITALFDHFGLDHPAAGERQTIREIEGHLLKWERHGEFESFTLAEAREPRHQGVPWRDRSVLWTEIADLVATHHPGRCVVACRVAVVDVGDGDPTAFDPTPYFEPGEMRGAAVLGGAGAMWTDFRIGKDGYTQFVTALQDMTPTRRGRLVQRILEIETYRFMAMLGFPVARSVQQKLTEIENELLAITNSFGDDDGAPRDRNADRDLLDRIQQMAMDASQVSEASSFRLSATAAYDAIVHARIEELREQRIEGISRPSTFLNRRMGPAMATCDTVRRRQQDVSRRISDASMMLRARVDIAMETQTLSILETIQNTSKTQVRLQRAVEGLSIVAISYYLISILNVFLKGGEKIGILPSWELAGAAIAPIAIILVIYLSRRATRPAKQIEEE